MTDALALDEVVEAFKTLGLTSYEAGAYTSLALAGKSDANAIAHAANVPTGRVYDVLNALVERGLVTVDEGSRPKSYKALPPRVALANLLAHRRKELDDKYSELTRLASDVEKRLSPKVKGTSGSFYHVSMGEAEAREFLTQKVQEATREICVDLQFKRYERGDEALFEAFAAAVSRGVKVKVLVSETDVEHIIESEYNALIARTMLPHLGKDLEVGLVTGEQVPFGIIDGEKALVGVKNPLDPGSFLALVYVWEPKFATELRAQFDKLWDGAMTDLNELVRLANTDG